MHPIKIISLICFLLSSFLTTAQDYQLNGRVSILNSRVKNGPIKYVKNVKISNELSPTRITDYKGRFKLKFIDLDPESIINLEVEKEGYEVVNKDVLMDIQISKNPTIRIFLAKIGKVEKKKKGLLQYSQSIVSARKDSIFHLLNLKAVSDDDVLKQLESNFGQKISDEMEAKLLLNQSDQELEKELPGLIHHMASVNTDFTSDRYKKAVVFFHRNQLDEAIKTLDEKELDSTFENILASLEKAKETPESYQKIRNIRSMQIDNIIESFRLKSTFLKMAFRVVEAEDLTEKIENMKSLVKEDQPSQILKDENKPVDIVAVEQIVNIFKPTLEDTTQIAIVDTTQMAMVDTNWVELETLVSKGGEEEEMTGDPKAKTILETLPNNSGLANLGVDFENTLLIRDDVKPYEVPVYERPTSVLISSEKVMNSSPEEHLTTKNQEGWLEFSEVIEPEVKETPPSRPQLVKEVKDGFPSYERMVYDDIIEPNYSVYKITKKTSLRQKATASSKVLKRLKVGTKVKVIDQVDRYWSKVIMNGKVGYVKVLLLEKAN